MSARGRAVAAGGGRRWEWLGGLCAVTLSLLAVIGCGGSDRVVASYSGELEGLDTLFDFTARARSARVLRETRGIDPGSAADRGLLVAGWGRPEVDPGNGRTFVWAIAAAVTLEVTLLQPAATTFRFVCRPFVVDGMPSQTVEVVVNGVPVGAVTLARRTRAYSLDIPAERVRPGRNQIDLRFAYAESPSRRDPGSDDQRTLAAAFEAFHLHPAAAAASGRENAAPAAGPSGLVLPAGTGLAFTVVPEGEVVLDLGAVDNHGATGVVAWFGAPGGDKEMVGRSRSGHRPVAIRWPEGRPLEIGFAAAGAAGSTVFAEGIR